MKKAAFYCAILFGLAGCAHVPTEVRMAMEKQAAELQQIRAKHRESVDILFAQIRALQLFILQEAEEKYREKYASGPVEVTLSDGTKTLIHRDPKTLATLPPSGNPNRDMIAVSTEKIIVDYFAAKRVKTGEELEAAKAEFLRLQDHIEIAQQINEAVTEYLDSLVSLRRAQRELGTNLVTKIGQIPGAAPFATRLLNILVPSTDDLKATLPKPTEKPATPAPANP